MTVDDERESPEVDDVDDTVVPQDDSMDVDGGDEPAVEPFVRYENHFYRVITMAAGGLVLILGLGGAVLSRTRDPQPPIQWFWVDLAVTVVLFTWYMLGMRCRLDVADEWVEINTKYGTRRMARSEVESVESDSSFWGAMQPAGRPLVLHLTNGKRVKAPACLPSDRLGLASAIEELQDTLGRPESVRTAELEESMAKRLASMSPEPDPAVEDSIRRRLESMAAEGEAADEVQSEGATTSEDPATDGAPGDEAASTSADDQS